MTAVIGILNKNAVAIAADSAVTVTGTNGSKIYNTANKIFTLSKFHPVSIVIYNSASFIGTPWEIIIKIYRNEIGEKSFPTLKDYSDDFFKFLNANNFFSTEETIQYYIRSFIYISIEDFVHRSTEFAMRNETNLILISEEERINVFKKYISEFLEKETLELQKSEQLEDFRDLTKQKCRSLTQSHLNKIIEENFPKLFDKELKNKYLKFFFHYIKSKKFYGQWSGLVFAGYGDNDIFPNTVSSRIACVFNNKIRYYTKDVEKIDDINRGSIMPFAQRDVIDTIISGISPDINKTLKDTFNRFLNGYNEELINLVSDSLPDLAKKLRDIDVDEISMGFMHSIDEVKQIKHVMPTVETVSILSKEDLAEMAESLIYLTYLKRRISSGEESVGGPIDVAVISKGDGFIWIKRKHYFEEKYNPHFKSNYFKN